MPLSGRSIIGFAEAQAAGGVRFRAINPTTRETISPDFFSASQDEVGRAARLANDAFATYAHVPGHERARFLRLITAKIEATAEEIIERAGLETALPKARLQGETTRTCNQLRLFADLVEDGSWAMARIDTADPERKPMPKPDIRSVLRPLGPVVVFGASNFPLAFSVAGGDTASVLAGGNPVIVKAHPAHPGTGELVGRAVQQATRECDLAEGVFSLLFDSGTEVGTALVKHPLIKAGGFTGSRAAGTALMKLASGRNEPIPFYAEMSSTNPVFILPGALRQHGEKIAAGLHASFTLGAGQFCTKPGVVFVRDGADAEKFTARLSGNVAAGTAPFHLLTAGIRTAYDSGIAARRSNPKLKLIAQNRLGDENGAEAAIFETDVHSFLDDPELAAEIFGPSTLVVRHSRREEVLEVAGSLEGHLTATIHGTEQDLREFSDLIAILERKVGRLIFNGFPTGVEVCHSMVHGGPFPATSDGRSTSVGSLAIYRFCRPVCYQGFPDETLPDELKDSNPLGIWRVVDGEMTRESIAKPEKLQATG